jgi:hypothetical protein
MSEPKKPGILPDCGEGRRYCEDCNGRGWVECEHDQLEAGPGSRCLDCGYDTSRDGPDESPYDDPGWEPDEDTLPGRGER